MLCTAGGGGEGGEGGDAEADAFWPRPSARGVITSGGSLARCSTARRTASVKEATSPKSLAKPCCK